MNRSTIRQVHRLQLAGPVALVSAALAIGSAGCGLLDDKFEVGDCVKLTAAIGGTDLKKADCADGSGPVADPIYRVDSVQDLGASCPPLRGFFPVQLDHEPDDVTYCLVVNS